MFKSAAAASKRCLGLLVQISVIGVSYSGVRFLLALVPVVHALCWLALAYYEPALQRARDHNALLARLLELGEDDMVEATRQRAAYTKRRNESGATTNTKIVVQRTGMIGIVVVW